MGYMCLKSVSWEMGERVPGFGLFWSQSATRGDYLSVVPAGRGLKNPNCLLWGP